MKIATRENVIPGTDVPLRRPASVAKRSSIDYAAVVSTVIPQRELRNDNARILDAVARGESFVITRHGRPVAELRPIVDQRRPFVPSSELGALFAAGSAVDAAAFRADVDALLDNRLFVEATDGDTA